MPPLASLSLALSPSLSMFSLILSAAASLSHGYLSTFPAPVNNGLTCRAGCLTHRVVLARTDYGGHAPVRTRVLSGSVRLSQSLSGIDLERQLSLVLLDFPPHFAPSSSVNNCPVVK